MRDIDSSMVTALTQKNADVALLAQMDFDSGTLYMWTGYGDLSWDSKTFIGGGNMVGISVIEETQDLQAKGLELSLNGVSTDIVALELTQKTRGRPFKMWLAIVVDNAVVGVPYRIFTGMMDVLMMRDGGTTSTLVLTVENSNILGRRSKIRRYTEEDQKKYYPNDTGFDRVPQLQDKEVVW